jgi:hypothetical protein
MAFDRIKIARQKKLKADSIKAKVKKLHHFIEPT